MLCNAGALKSRPETVRDEQFEYHSDRKVNWFQVFSLVAVKSSVHSVHWAQATNMNIQTNEPNPPHAPVSLAHAQAQLSLLGH